MPKFKTCFLSASTDYQALPSCTLTRLLWCPPSSPTLNLLILLHTQATDFQACFLLMGSRVIDSGNLCYLSHSLRLEAGLLLLVNLWSSPRESCILTQRIFVTLPTHSAFRRACSSSSTTGWDSTSELGAAAAGEGAAVPDLPPAAFP